MGGQFIFMYSFNNILIATDFSPAAWQAIKAGVALAKVQFAKIVLLHVHPDRNENIDEIERTHYTNIKNKISKITSELSSNNNLSIKSVVLKGNVSEVITSYIKKHNIDLILMGANSGYLDSHLGSHTTLIIESTKVPVMVVPPIIEENVGHAA